ncbi:Cytochrome c oxidase biogenesis protein Cmc1-like, partial [Trinorchestia longiramus]
LPDFSSCSKEAGLLMVSRCRAENTALWSCLEKWYFDEAFKERCTKEYLAERSEFRRTGVRRSPRNHRAELRKEA